MFPTDNSTRCRGAVFLDREGVLNHVVARNGRVESPHTCDEFRLIEAASCLFDLAKQLGYLTWVLMAVTTNQPDVKRGLLTHATLGRFWMQGTL